MDNVTFALPTIGSNDMSKDDQGALIVNQAAAIIISAWLTHATALMQKDPQYFGNNFNLTPAELVTLINDVQNALKSF
ncbi:MAG: hypothetical protein ACMUJM_20465 [bacterium]